MKVMDFFCGAGGFSEGFRQAGCDILLGVDNWIPAVETFKLNFPEAKILLKDIGKISDNEIIDSLPNVDILIGSPPCQSFSTSNKLGNANKTQGIFLIKTFLKIVVIKRETGCLKAWFMENVSNSLKYLEKSYTYSDLNLSKFAKERKISPRKIAISLNKNKIKIIASNDFGVAQKRNRAFVGEIIKTGMFPDMDVLVNKKQKNLKELFKNIPKPIGSKKASKSIKDPNYQGITIKQNQITDHFYDSGSYKMAWQDARLKKTNHPFMGRMDFPENLNKPSRTVTTQSGHSREGLFYKSEVKRKGNGEYREPTIRELALIMSFPIFYQFEGSINQKRKLVGNAVCPLVSYKICLSVFRTCRKKIKFINKFSLKKTSINLNDHQIKKFGFKKRRKGCKFRRILFKKDGIGINFSNFNFIKCLNVKEKWFLNVFSGYDIKKPIRISYNRFKKIEKFIMQSKNGLKFIQYFINFCEIENMNNKLLQESYEIPDKKNNHLDPDNLLSNLETLILKFSEKERYCSCENLEFFEKKKILEIQLYAIYSLYIIEKIINNPFALQTKPSYTKNGLLVHLKREYSI